jgi:hypothetical protein
VKEANVAQPHIHEIEYQDPDGCVTYLYVATGPKRAVELYARDCRTLGELAKPGDREEVVVRQYPMPWQEGELKPISAKPKRFLIVLSTTYYPQVTEVTPAAANR